MSENQPTIIAVRLTDRPSRVLLPAASGLLTHAKSIQARADTEADPQLKAELAGVADLYVDLAECLGAAVNVALQRENEAKADKAGLN